MKKIITLSVLFLVALALKSQDNVLLMAENSSEADQSFSGKYIGFHNTTSAPYHVDAYGRISGRHLTFHADGSIETLGNYRMGIKHGLWMSYDTNGNVLSQAYYSNGKRDGAWKVWDAHGVLRCEMYYANGQRIKTWKFYDSNGLQTGSRTYGH